MVTLKLTDDFREFLRLLNSSGIEYLLVGGYAVGLYGHVRPTKDIDLWVAVDPANLAKITEVLVQFGFSRGSVPDPLFAGVQTNLRMGRPPNQLELLSAIAGVDFDVCYSNRSVMHLDGVDVPVIDYSDLLANKRAAGRARDLADVQQLQSGTNRRPKRGGP